MALGKASGREEARLSDTWKGLSGEVGGAERAKAGGRGRTQ